MYAIASADLNKYNIEMMKALKNPRSFNNHFHSDELMTCSSLNLRLLSSEGSLSCHTTDDTVSSEELCYVESPLATSQGFWGPPQGNGYIVHI